MLVPGVQLIAISSAVFYTVYFFKFFVDVIGGHMVEMYSDNGLSYMLQVMYPIVCPTCIHSL